MWRRGTADLCWRGSKYRWTILPEEFPVPFCGCPGAVNPDCVAVVGSDLDHNTGVAPLLGVVAVLVLDVDMVARDEWGEIPGSLCHLFLCPGPGFGEGIFPGFGCEPPLLFGEELARLERERVPDLSPEYYLGWAKACIRAGSVPVHQDGLDEVVGVQGARL